ncbi:MAG: outer membrane protein assembly factor BamA [Prevotellaceae bacterium]|jgi:outer membrane protein insertion porin family|nr:outer membrane protein assembly factor BamA [Prevotellaceae bacterium]
MNKSKLLILILLSVVCSAGFAQENELLNDTTVQNEQNAINYDAVKKLAIADIRVTGDITHESYVVIGFSGLSVGQTISVPGSEITSAVSRFWKQGYFSQVQILTDKITSDSIWLNISLKQRPKISQINYFGIKKSEKEDIEKKANLSKGDYLTTDLIDRIKIQIKKYFAEKGFENADATVLQKNADAGSVALDINVDKGVKVKVHEIYVSGNKALSVRKIDKAMKKTHRSTYIFNIFKSKKFIKSEYENDKNLVIVKYNEIGYRDAEIISDSVVHIDSAHVDIYLKINEGKKYYFGDIIWIGNTIYPSSVLSMYLNINKGDVYNLKHLNKRLTDDEDAVASLYKDNGYLFFNIDPVESGIAGDTINFEMRIYEGKPATISNVVINGNDRVYEHVVRRELRTRPGAIYSQNDLVRSLRDLAQMKLFDEEKLFTGVDIQPNVEDGTVDIAYNLQTKSSDQFEFSAGYGAQGIVLSVGVKFTNFAIQNLFKKDMYRILPQGEGQTFGIKAQANGKYYQNYSIQFYEPWLGGKRPNSLSVGAYYSIQNGYSERYLNNMNATYGNYYNSYYNGMYGTYGNDYYNNAYLNPEYDSSTKMQTLGFSLGIGTRLKWPDDYFSLYTEFSYQNYNLKNWYKYLFGFSDGKSINLSLGITLQRNSIDNPIYTRHGSMFTFSVAATPPYSVFGKKDYSKLPAEETRRWIEYHKWKFSGKMYVPLSKNDKLVLMSRVEYGFVGYYNKYKQSPFEKFYVGGDGMSGYTTPGTETIGLRGYTSGALTPVNPITGNFNGNLYTRLTMELRYPIMMQQSTTIWALVFVEGGNCWDSLKKFNPFDLKRSAGVGLRVYLPMFGLLGVDWGYGFDKINGNTSSSGSQFTFVLGQEF